MQATASSFTDRILASKLIAADTVHAARKFVGDDDAALAHYLVREGLLTRFQARQIRAGATGFFVDKYVVVDCIGRGGNGIVYKAKHTMLAQRYVALKTLDARDLHSTDDSLARFRREIDIVSRLDHPNVVRAYDVLRTRTQMYLVLEYVEGRDLSSYVRERGKLPVHEAVDYVIQAARGLAFAHKCGIIHRDLKPGNLLLSRDGVVKLSDLGLARIFGQGTDAELTLDRGCIGTPEFMAPEQAEDSARADTRSDIYSLGATLFHLLTAELPVLGSNSIHRLQRLLVSPPRPLLESRADAPVALAAVADRLRARDSAARPATADEVIALLEPFLHYRPDEPEAWDGPLKASLVLDVLRGQTTAAAVCAQNRIAADEFERWRKRFVEAGARAFDPHGVNGEAVNGMLRDLHAKIGAQAMEIEALKARLPAAERNGS
jgi:serine/threonine protein kinase